MNQKLAPTKTSGGFSTIELLVAIAVFILGFSAVAMVAFGNDSVVLDSQLNNEALGIAQESLEAARATAKDDFSLLVSSDVSTTSIYTSSLVVEDTTPCRKNVTSQVEWNPSALRPQTVTLSTVFTSLAELLDLGGDCSVEETSGDAWGGPTPLNMDDPVFSGSDGLDIDVIEQISTSKRFALIASDKQPGKATLWVVNVTDLDNIMLEGTYTTDADMNAIDATSETAFMAGASTTDQFHIVDITDPANPTLLASAGLDSYGVDPAGISPAGYSIYYYKDKVYIGLKRTAGPEFHVFDVSNLSAPVHLGSLELNHNINDIMVKGDYAYIASSADGCELIVVDVSNPAAMVNPCPAPPVPAGNTVYNAPGDQDGTAVYILGTKVYLGRARAQDDHDFYILDASDLTDITSLGSIDLDLNPNTVVRGIIAKWPVAFLSTEDTTPGNGGGPLLIFNISDPSNIFSTLLCPVNWSEKSTGIDVIDDIIYTSNESGYALRIIYASPVCAP